MPGRGPLRPLSLAKRRIMRYLDHLQDPAYVAGVLALADLAAIDGLLAEMLRSGDREESSQANLFVRDTVLYGFSPPFRDLLPRSRTVRALRENLYSPDYQTRHQAVYALGKLSLPANARYLVAAFPWYLEHDPLGLDGLLFEIGWLRRRSPRWRLVEQIATAPSYLTRWAAVETLWMRDLCSGVVLPAARTVAWAGALLERLARDDHPWVRVEAASYLAELDVARRTLRPGQTWGAPFRPDRAAVPLTFDALRQNVGNYLAITGRADYDLALVERIVAHLGEHPIALGYDIEAYWRGFDALRGVS